MKTKLIDYDKKKPTISRKHEKLTYNLPEIVDGYLPRCEYHARFPAITVMNEPARFNTYFRSDMKALEEVKVTEAKFQGNQEQVKPMMYPKTGNFYNPFHFENYKELVEPSEETRYERKEAYWYDKLLNQKKDLAKYIVDEVKKSNATIELNADYRYPCVLVEIPKPEGLKNVSISTELAGVFLIAIVNCLVYERGINIELHRRSSFDHLRPSIAECDQSLRVSLGLIPKAYADCLVEGIVYTQKLMSKTSIFEVAFVNKSLKDLLDTYNKDIKKKERHVKLQGTLWDTLWSRGDSKGNTFAYQIFRKPIVVEYLIDSIMNECLKDSIDNIFKKTSRLRAAFVTPLINLFDHFELTQQKTLSFVVNEALETYQWEKEECIDDASFWKTVKGFAQAIGVSEEDAQLLVTHKKTTHLHSYFEHMLKEFTFTPIANEAVEDGCGSDSLEEGEFQLDNNKTVELVGKKLITSTGMRAIQLVYAAGKTYLFKEYSADPSKITFSAELMYYETKEALKNFAIPLDLDHETTKSKKKHNITFFDLNHCNSGHYNVMKFIQHINKDDVICVVDVTSATTDEMNTMLEKLLTRRKNLEVIVFVSSGLKNEQGMSDYNPYGSVRIFAKGEDSLDLVYKTIKALEEEAGYAHPLESHLIRKTAKYYGMTPTNESILKF